MVTIVIYGQFDRSGNGVAETIDSAVHEAGVLGCAGRMPAPARSD